jgi:predicted nucleic acid-binding protein
MPATGRVLLDTNILIALLAEEALVVRHVQEADAVYVPAIALGELYYGARKSARAAARGRPGGRERGARLRCGDGCRLRRAQG